MELGQINELKTDEEQVRIYVERSAKWGPQHKKDTVKESEMMKREDV